jgi:hypothetical protein
MPHLLDNRAAESTSLSAANVRSTNPPTTWRIEVRERSTAAYRRRWENNATLGGL